MKTVKKEFNKDELQEKVDNRQKKGEITLSSNQLKLMIWDCIKKASDSDFNSIKRNACSVKEDMDFIGKWVDERLKETQ